ncbi:MAG: trimethylamine methyltransferase family protein [Acidimicrobiales bacterium]|nr:trimethylamine methyltransferase family protein [Acidimicrobiales bacterium]RZV42908.1 MAG: trimethylamine methyltransferase [Acidimicrobiales bacterium]
MARRRRERQPVDVSFRRQLVNPFEPLRVLSEDEVEHVHQTSIRYLADSGIKVLLDEARHIFGAGGAVVDDDSMVRLDPDMVRSALTTAPASFELHAPNPIRNVPVGGRSVALLPVGGPPFVSDLSGGRRAGTLEDQRNFLRLTQIYDVLAATAPCVEPSDIPLAVRHLESGVSTLTLTDKVPFIYARGRQRTLDSFELVKIRHGIRDDETFASKPYCWTNINTNSPRQLDVPMSMGIIDFARMMQPCIMTPFTLAGAMAPVTLAGALLLQHMEVLAAVTLSQLVRPGAPVVYGAFTSNVDMKSGSPAFGTPEAMKGALASGQLARHVGLPWRSSGSSSSNVVDAQAGYETMANTYGALLAGANVILHAAGWQEGGLTASFEKFIVDVEMCQVIADWFKPVVVDDSELALEAIDEVGPGGHFFGAAHTLDRYETAFYSPLVFERTNFEQWTDKGSLRANERAETTWRSALENYVEPTMDDAVRAEMRAFVDRRTTEGGAAPD